MASASRHLDVVPCEHGAAVRACWQAPERVVAVELCFYEVDGHTVHTSTPVVVLALLIRRGHSIEASRESADPSGSHCSAIRLLKR